MSSSGVRLGSVDTELPTPAALADATANPTVPSVGSPGLVFNGATWDRARSAGVGDGAALTGLQSVVQSALVSAAAADRLRTPAVFRRAATTTAGSTALWTPAAGKKFRLMRFKVQITGNSAQAAGGNLTVSLLDGATDLGLGQNVFVPAAGGAAMGLGFDSGWLDLGNGPLSAAANNTLNINLSAALTAGNVNVVACGTEE